MARLLYIRELQVIVVAAVASVSSKASVVGGSAVRTETKKKKTEHDVEELPT